MPKKNVESFIRDQIFWDNLKLREAFDSGTIMAVRHRSARMPIKRGTMAKRKGCNSSLTYEI
jgi:hypothetical protein